MRDISKSRSALTPLAVLFTIPFTLSQWMPLAIEFSGSPEVKVMGDQLQIKTEDAAGGFAYLFDEPVALDSEQLTFSWDWAIQDFPKVKYQRPLTKDTEDFAIRVGLLLSDGKSRIPLPSKFSRALKKKGHKLSHVLFYNAASEFGPFCDPSPYHENILNCVKKTGSTKTGVLVPPAEDAAKGFGLSKEKLSKMKIFGVWLFADSDNSESSSCARVSNLKLQTSSKKTPRALAGEDSN